MGAFHAALARRVQRARGMATSSSLWTPFRPRVVDPEKAAVDAPPRASLLDPATRPPVSFRRCPP